MEDAARERQDYAFGDVRVEAGAHRLLRDGVVMPVEPKAFAVLLELLAHPGQLVARDALLDAVWGHRHVTPAVLNRVIAMLRKAIGDDADAPRCIETVHGLGYRFIAPLRTDAGAPSDATAVAPIESATLPAAAPVQPAPASTPLLDPAPAGRDAVAAPAAAGSGSAAVSRALLAVAVVAVLALGWSLWRQSRVAPVALLPPPTGVAPAAHTATVPTVAVLPLRLPREEPEARALADGLGESFEEMLGRLDGLRVSGRDSVRIAAAQAAEPVAAGRLLAADYVLHGTLDAPPGGSVALDLDLQRVADGVTVWTSAFQQPRDQLFRVIGPTYDGLRGALLPAAPVAKDALVRTSDSAQELYWRARQLLRWPERGDPDQAAALLRRAIEIDPDFGLAYCALADALRTGASDLDVDLQSAVAQAQVALARAQEIDPRLLCAQLGAAFILTTQWRAPQAEARVRRALEIDPDNVVALSLAGNLAAYQGRPREALATFDRAQALDPLSPAPRIMRWFALLQLGRVDELRSMMAQAPGNRAASIQFLARALLAEGRLAEALRALDDVDMTADSTLYALMTQVTLRALLGDLEGANQAMAQVPEGRSRAPIYGEARARLLWQGGQYRDALAWLDSADGVKQPDPWRAILRGHSLALAGDGRAALADYDAAFANDLDRRTIAYSWYGPHFGLGELANWAALRAMQGGDAAAARGEFAGILDGMVEGGVDMAAVHYLLGLRAALDGDAERADRQLGVAIERGWLDRLALDIDLPWRAYRDAPWLQARRAQIADRIAAERALRDADDAAR